MEIHTLRIPIAFLCAVCLVGCGQSRQLNPPSSSLLTSSNSAHAVTPPAHIEPELRAFAESWSGTPHLEGGSSKSGIDASGLVMIIAEQILGTPLPHSTARQLGFGLEVERRFLIPGDIVFFRPTSMPRHVGVYLGSQEFLHSWPDGGVSIARMDEPYWNGAYWVGRRLLDLLPTDDAPATPDEPPPLPPKRRVGW